MISTIIFFIILFPISVLFMYADREPTVNYKVSDPSPKYNVHSLLRNSMDMSTLKTFSTVFNLPIKLLVLSCDYNINISTMVRTACCFGLQSVYVFTDKRLDRRGMVGTNNYIKVQRIDSKIHKDIKKWFIDFVNKENIFPIFIEQGGKDLLSTGMTHTLRNVLASGKTPCIVMGSESTGIPDELLNIDDSSTIIYSIPQCGMARSLNVAVCCGIVLAECQRSLTKMSCYVD